MSMMQDILSQLQGLGLSTQSYDPISGGYGGGGNWMGLSNITPQLIEQAMTTQFGLHGKDLNPALFQGISPELLQAGLGKTYRPQIEAKGSSLLSNLQTTLGGKVGKQAAGGFAGSGQQQRFTSGAKDVYGQGMTDILATSGQQRSQGMQSVQDIINQWVETAADIKGY